MKRSQWLTLFLGLSNTSAVLAYIGPGAGISALGTALVFVLVIILLLVGFLWYPVKKLMSKNKHGTQLKQETENPDSDSDQARGL